jgi:protein tyrosine/serine phosphatase
MERHVLKRIFYFIAILAAIFFFISGLLSFYPNFYVVIPNTVYRSAQLNYFSYLHYLKKYHIKSVINLEGAYPNMLWYQNELRASRELQIQHYDLQLPATHTADPANMQALADLIQTAPKPLLIHCWRGADRTGLASAMSIIMLSDAPLENATAQISWHFGVVSPHSIGKLEFHLYENWLKEYHLENSRENFLRWIISLSKH